MPQILTANQGIVAFNNRTGELCNNDAQAVLSDDLSTLTLTDTKEPVIDGNGNKVYRSVITVITRSQIVQELTLTPLGDPVPVPNSEQIA
jgi:hypothetical protein